MTTTAIPALILAAGGSRRLGQPKQLVRIGDEPLLARVIRIARVAGAQPVFVVLGDAVRQIQGAVDLSGAKVVLNERWMQGIASSIRAGLRAIQQQCDSADGVLILACDQPYLESEHIEKMLAAFRQQNAGSIVASAYADGVGVPAIFPKGYFGKLLELQGDRGARFLLEEAAADVLGIELPGGEIDIDTPEDLGFLH